MNKFNAQGVCICACVKFDENDYLYIVVAHVVFVLNRPKAIRCFE